MIGEKTMFFLLAFLTVGAIVFVYLLHAMVPEFFSPQAEGERPGEANFIFLLIIIITAVSTVCQGIRSFRKKPKS